jgi:DNA topoisomerase-1
MKKILLIVESPAKIKTISKLLGPEFTVVSTVGHIKDLPKKSLGITMRGEHVELEYVVMDKKEKVIKDLIKAAKAADLVLLASDPDREGEVIAWHVEQELKDVIKNPHNIKRITYNEITKTALQAAIQHQGPVDLQKVHAQQARRALDRLVGYEASPILWKVRKGLSAGRVQSVALRLICDREEAIRAFKSEESWSIEALGRFDKHTLPLTLTHIKNKKIALKKEDQAKKVADQLKDAVVAITVVTDTTRSKRPPTPFITSTLQQSASQQLGLKVARTMELAQKLYEGVPLEDEQTPVALITYMRTDSTRLADSAVKEIRTYIKKRYGNDYVPGKPQVYATKKKGQDAHEAIRPVDVSITPELTARYLEPALQKLYTLIWKRSVACQMSDAQFAHRKVTVEGDGFTLTATGTTILFDGFRKLYITADEEQETNIALPAIITANTPIILSDITPRQHFTQPPARFSEASLIKELEKEGIGRPSTYATILKTIQMRDYTELDEKKRFVPTDLGFIVTRLLVENLPKIMNTSFTAEMETDLDKIAQGEMNRDKLVHDFYTNFSHDLKEFQKNIGVKPLETTNIKCPSCKKHNLIVRFGKAGAFAACPGYPECKFTSNFARKSDGTIELVDAPKPVFLEEKCPNCGSPLRQLIGRFGPFIACSAYPKCKYIKQQTASFPCPQCGNKITKRSWKGKIFWGCSGYPTCKFSIAGDIQDTPCPKCKSPYLRKKTDADGDVLTCPNTETCGYTITEKI